MASKMSMSINSIEQIKIDLISKLVQGSIPFSTVMDALNVSERTLWRYLKEFKEEGAMFVKHGNWNRAAHNRIKEEEKLRIIKICKEKYSFLNRTHTFEKLKEKHNIKISYATFNRWCVEEKILNKKANKRKRLARYRRDRMSSQGIMLQMDGSPHCWFARKKTCLVIAIDDADGKILAGNFSPSETTFSCMIVLNNAIKNNGIFSILYVDRAGIFGGNSKKTIPFKRAEFSQLKDRLELLGIQTIYAHSPQAKGRVERAFSTLQDRLVAEMKLNNIFTIEEANIYFNTIFLPEIFNKNFVVLPEKKESSFKPIPSNLNLDDHFYMKESRKVRKDHTINYQGKNFDLVPTEENIADETIEIRKYPNGATRLYCKDKEIFLKNHVLKAA